MQRATGTARIISLSCAILAIASGARAQDAQSVFVGPPAGPVAAESAPSRAATPAPIPDDARPLGAPERPNPLTARADTPREPTPRSTEIGPGWWRTAGMLCLVLAIILALAALARRLAASSGGLMHALGAGGRAPSGLLQVLGRYPVGRGQTLILLKLDRRVLLVCQSVGARGAGMRTLCELTEPEEVASVLMRAAEAEGRTMSGRFRELVAGFEAGHERFDDDQTETEPAAGRTGPRGASAPDATGALASRLEGLRRRALEVSA
jgi:flagellar biogenesis protein FliO